MGVYLLCVLRFWFGGLLTLRVIRIWWGASIITGGVGDEEAIATQAERGLGTKIGYLCPALVTTSASVRIMKFLEQVIYWGQIFITTSSLRFTPYEKLMEAIVGESAHVSLI